MEQRVLKQDGYLELGTSMSGGDALSNRLQQCGEMDFEISSIIYHTHLNVVLVFDNNGTVKIIDVHTGITLQTYQFSNDKQGKLYGHFMPLQEKILITDGYNIGFRGDYNGVLLLDTILQSPVTQNDDIVRLEILLSEAILLQSCIKELEQEGLECPSDVSNELMEKIKSSQSFNKKGIKAQRWSTICLEVPYSSLKLLANNMVIMLKRLERHVPVLAIASAINERLTDLLAGSRVPDINWHCNNIQRILMHSEAIRRQTFEKWPHMDYKWALPDQMAQAGFYHQPSSSGEDRAMCFTCNVCLVCWEKTDEPWSEHERHSPMCPFVKGEYTQNVPLAVTYATNPAVKVPSLLGFDVISNSDYANVLCTSCSHTGDLIIWSIERHLKQMHCFNIASLMKDIICNNTSDNDATNDTYEWVCVTAICVLPNAKAQNRILTLRGSPNVNLYGGSTSGIGIGRGISKDGKNLTSGATQSKSSSARAGIVGSRIILGLSTLHTSGEYVLRLVVLNIVESERSSNIIHGTRTTDSGEETQKIGINIVSKTPSASGGGDDTSRDNREDKSHTSSSNEKYTDGFDSTKSLTSDLLATTSNKKSDAFTTVTGDQSDLVATKFFDLNLEKNLKKINQFCDLTIFDLMDNTADKTVTNNGTGTGIGSGNGSAGSGGGINCDAEVELALIDKKLMENIINSNANYKSNQNNKVPFQQQQHVSKNNYSSNNSNCNKIDNNNHNNNNNYENNNVKDMKTTNSNETTTVSNSMSKLTLSDDVDCIVESCTTLKRMNALNAIDDDDDVNMAEVDCHRRQKELVQIAEILPTNSNCNKLLVKLVKAKAPRDTDTNKIIMANIENENDNINDNDNDFDNQTGVYQNNEGGNVKDTSSVACQILLFDYLDGIIPNEHKMAITFSRAKFPRQLCLLPNFIVSNNYVINNDTPTVNQLDNNNRNASNVTNDGAFCAVCDDGTIEIYSLNDFKCVSIINEPGHHFVAVAYCNSLERLCCCTNNGALLFYSLNDADNDSGDEMLDLDEDNNTVNLLLQQEQNNLANMYDKNSQNCAIELSVTDGVAGGGGNGGNNADAGSHETQIKSMDSKNDTLHQQQQQKQQQQPCHGNIKVDCSGSVVHSNNVYVASTASNMQSSPSPSTSSTGASSSANLLAYRTGDLTLDDLHTLHALTQFDENLTVYGAEVPSCWSDLVQAQKQRKQPQSMRNEDLQFTKTWRLHNDTTTWDEHIIELNLLQAVNLGHIDLKFTLYQQCHNPAAIQVTLLKQNTSSYGYRMKGHHPGYKHHILEDNSIHQNFGSMTDGNNENPVLNEEYLHTHNAEVLAGPIELSSCLDLGEQSGTVTLTSPKLFKTRTRNFLLHIKTMADPTKEIPSKNRVPARKSGIMRLLSSSFANNSSTLHNFMHKSSSNNVISTNATITNTTGPIVTTIGKVVHPCIYASMPPLLNINNNNYNNLNNNISNATSTSVNTTANSFPTKISKNMRHNFFIGCDWLHEISICVRGVRSQLRVPNERLQRIAMLESNQLIETLFKIVSTKQSTALAKTLALDILIWICCIRLKRYRSPKSERIKMQINKQTAPSCPDLVAQQFECICLTEKYLENTLRECIIGGDRSLAHKCLKLIILLTDGICNLPPEIQAHTTLDVTMRDAIANTFNELPLAKYASAVYWYATLTWVTSTLKCYQGIPELCIKLLTEVAEQINKRSDPYCALLGTRFGLYGFPFEAEIFDFDLTNVNKNNVNFSSILTTIIRTNAGVFHAGGIDIKKLSSIDGVDLRTFPQLIRCKSVSNQLRGLLEVEQLHFTCVCTSEATRIDNVDTITPNTNNTSNINVDDLVAAPMLSNEIDLSNTLDMNDFLNNVKNNMNKLVEKLKLDKAQVNKYEYSEVALKPNGIGSIDPSEPKYCDEPPLKINFMYEEQDNNQQQSSSSTTVAGTVKTSMHNNTNNYYKKASNKDVHANEQNNTEHTTSSEANRSLTNNNGHSTSIYPWHKLLMPPSKQMIVIDRMHSGARRFVVLDFGSPILLTDIFIPSCDDLASLHIDIWCLDENTDSIRLVVAPDIGGKTLVLSDLQPPPICRYLKITVTGRIGMSSTKCKIPIGSFFGHVIVLESDIYADPYATLTTKYSTQNLQAQVKALTSLYEDVHCRYSLASCKLLELLTPIVNSEMSNIAHMQAFINRQRDDDSTLLDNSKITSIYEECILLQHQMYAIQNVIRRLASSSVQVKINNDVGRVPTKSKDQALQMASRDKLRVLGQTLIEMLLNFSIEYNIKDLTTLHQHFTKDVAKVLFNALVVHGDAHIQLATCSLLVRTCCFQSWWGEFLMDIFCCLFSSQNTKIFPQDRIFFMLTYLGRRSIAMGACRSIVIDAILKTLAKLIAPISPLYQELLKNELQTMANDNKQATAGLWAKSDLQLTSWLLLFLSICLDDSSDRKDKSANRWEFMSCDSEFSKPRTQTSTSNGKQLRCFKKRIVQQKALSVQPYTEWGKKIYMIQNDHPGIFMELSGKPKLSNKTNKTGVLPRLNKDHTADGGSNFDKGLKTIRLNNILIVIRGLIALLLEMDFTCNMDKFLLTCKVIARLVSACRPAVQLSKIITTNQLEQLIRLAVWNDQHQPWAVHAITCLLQDLLDADKHFKDNDIANKMEGGGVRSVDGNVPETKDIFGDYTSLYLPPSLGSIAQTSTNNDMQYTDGIKYPYLPSLIECDDTEFDEILNDIDLTERKPNVTKKEATGNKNTYNFFCKSLSGAMDARLDTGLNLHVEMDLRRINIVSSLDMFSSLPQIMTNDIITNTTEVMPWPEYITDVWSGPEYNCTLNTYHMFKNVFDCILADLHLQETWVHLEQVLQMWLTLNHELTDKSFNGGCSDVPKIPFGANAAQGLLLALAWHSDIKLRTWCLGFQCLVLACNSQPINDGDMADTTRINEVIITDENFEKMLLRFLSGYGMSSPIITNRCVGPTICKHLHELLLWLHRKGETTDNVIVCKRKLKDTLLHVVLQLIQPGGAISNQLGPIDAQGQLIRDLLTMPNDKADLNVSLNIMECVTFLVYNNISNGDKLQCQRTSDANNPSNTFTSLFANVLPSDHSKHSTPISDNALIISLLKLCSSLIQTELPRQLSDVSIPEEEDDLITNESQADEIKAEQLNIEGHRIKTPCIADTVLRHFPTMKRLLGSLSHSSSNSFTLMPGTSLFNITPTDTTVLFEDAHTIADAVFNMLIALSEKASNHRLIVAPICQYLETNSVHRNVLPRLHMSEPLLWYIFRVLKVAPAVEIFAQLGGVQIICKNLISLNKSLINMQPGLISLIMQHITRDTKLKVVFQTSGNNNNNNSKKNSTIQAQRHLKDGLINFAPFCAISVENDTAQSADILISNPVAPHRRPRTPAWSYMFYPNESHADLTITFPTAILLKEVQLQPHAPTLATCPSAVALEISRDVGMGPIPVGPPLCTTGMTCIRLKLAKPEIATSIVLRLYRPKDSSSIGLTQIAVLGNTIFGSNYSNVSNTSNNNIGGTSSTMSLNPTNTALDQTIDDDSFAKTSIGWIRILSRCFSVATNQPSTSKLAAEVIGASATYPGFLEACCSLLNIMPMIPNSAIQNLETVLLTLGAHSRDMCLSLLRILLWGTTPQVYTLSNESTCNLLYDLCTSKDSHTLDKIEVLLEWILKLKQNYNNNAIQCNNPQSGLIKCIASILWDVHAESQLTCANQLQNYITNEIFDACFSLTECMENGEPLKIAFDSLICSLCYIKPILFERLLIKVEAKLPQDTVSGNSRQIVETPANVDSHITRTDDNNGEVMNNVRFENCARTNLLKILERPSYLSTIALACQSPEAVTKLVDSGLPKLLACALYEYCTVMVENDEFTKINNQRQQKQEPRQYQKAENTAGMSVVLDSTDADTQRNEKNGGAINKEGDKAKENSEDIYHPPLLKSNMVPKILEFFSECCAEGYMRDWLGTEEGAIFWKPLLHMLCNRRSFQLSDNLDTNDRFECISEPIHQTFLRIERATIEFFTRVSTCQPKNQDTLTALLIDVIRQPPIISPYLGLGNKEFVANASTAAATKVTISGFTRQLVLQLLLENERILISVRSKQSLERKDSHCTIFSGHSNVPGITSANFPSNAASASSNGVSMSLINHHPSMRTSTHHLLFLVSTNSKCQYILENCISDSAITLPGAMSGTAINNEIRKSMLGNDTFPQQQYDDAFGELTVSLNNIDTGMEFLSVAAGVTAKDKRAKDAKNQVTAAATPTTVASSAAEKGAKKGLLAQFTKFVTFDDYMLPSTPKSNTRNKYELVHPDYPNVLIRGETTISQLLAALSIKGYSLSTPHITLHLVNGNEVNTEEGNIDEMSENNINVQAASIEPLQSPLQRFSSRGGLSLLAHYLPTVFPDNSNRKTSNAMQEKEKSPPMTDWVKLEPNDDIYEDLEDPLTDTNMKHMAVTITSVPQHSLAAFGLFLRLPTYSDVLLRDKLRAQCLLRLVLGVTGDGEGNDIYSLCLAPSLPTLPFEVLRQLLDCSPLNTDDGLKLRHMVIDVGAMHLLLNCLGVFTHQSSNYQLAVPQNEVINNGLKNPGNSVEEQTLITSDDKSHIYWAKGTGFGTGSTTQSWNVEQALLRQKSEEEHVTVLLQVLSSFINPGDRTPSMSVLESKMEMVSPNVDTTTPSKANTNIHELPKQFAQLLKQSCLIPALSSYLRNDSVLDITRHIPLYRAVLQLLRALSVSHQLAPLLQPQHNKSSPSIAELLLNMKTCVDTYAKRLKLNKKSNIKGQTQQIIVTLDDGDDEGLALLIPDIQDTTCLVQQTTHKANAVTDNLSISGCNSISGGDTLTQSQSIEERYLAVMKKLQFDTYDMIVEAENNGYRFTVSHHFEKMVRLAGDRYHPSRVKRLAQEAVTLSTSLPLSFSSSVFVRCDTDRLDVMKVLITGPADTPYANGCFEFDVFFPPDYPNQPMQINLETTGRHTVRFNPNLYNDGKVCLSVLNTWHGRPEEKWNAQTSSFLQVLVSIQSLILVPEPYFNEPGFERSRGTPSGTHSSREYNSNIFQACVRWAMLEQIRNPSPCFKEVIEKHFWLKRNEICTQIENWIEELGNPQYCERNTRTISFNAMVLRRQYRHLREELANLKAPEGLEDLDSPFSPHVTFPTTTDNVATTNTCTTSIAANNENTNINKIDNENGGGGLNSNVSTTVVNIHSNATTTEINNDNNNIIIFNNCDNNNEEDKSNIENDHNAKDNDDNSLVMATTLTDGLNALEDDEEYSVQLNVQTQPIDGVEIPIVNAACDVSEVLNDEEMYDFEEAVENCKYWW